MSQCYFHHRNRRLKFFQEKTDQFKAIFNYWLSISSVPFETQAHPPQNINIEHQNKTYNVLVKIPILTFQRWNIYLFSFSVNPMKKCHKNKQNPSIPGINYLNIFRVLFIYKRKWIPQFRWTVNSSVTLRERLIIRVWSQANKLCNSLEN